MGGISRFTKGRSLQLVLVLLLAGQLGALVLLERRVSLLFQRLEELSLSSRLGLLSPSSVLLMFSRRDPGFTLEDLAVMRRTSHGWLDEFIRRRALNDGDAILLRAVHDRWLGQYAETRVLEITGYYQLHDAEEARQVLLARYGQAAAALLGSSTAQELLSGLKAELPNWEASTAP